jgi:hypothetical protein
VATRAREEQRPSRKDVAERERDIGKGGHHEGEHLTTESGGQFALDRERLHEFSVRIYSKDMKSSEVVKVVPTRSTVYTGGVPQGESLEAVSKAFERHPLGIG